MGGTSDSDLIARIAIKFKTDSMKVDLDAVKAELKQLELASNQAFKAALLARFGTDIKGLTQELEKLGKAYIAAEDHIKAMGLVSETVTKKEIADAKLLEQEEIASNKRAAAARKDAAESQARVEKEIVAQEMHDKKELEKFAAEYEKAWTRSYANIAAAQKGLFSSLQAGASGNIGSMLNGILGQAMSGQLRNGTSGGLSGILAAGGAGLTSTLGLDAGMAATVGAVTLGVGALAAAPGAAAKGFLESYQNSVEFLGGVRRIQKELGTTASQTSALSSFMGLTQNPNSPFSAIIFSQVQANLQNLVDMENGLASAGGGGMAGGQIEKMADALSRLHVSARDASGNTKDIIQFSIDLSAALEGIKNTDPAKYSQAIQEIGGLFGKDFASVVGESTKRLMEYRDAAVKVTQADMEMSSERQLAYTKADNAQKQYELSLGRSFGPLDQAIQKFKQLAFANSAYALEISSQNGSFVGANLFKLNFDAIFNPKAYAEDVAAASKAMTDQQVADQKKSQNELKTTQRATEDYKYALKLLKAEYDTGMESQKQYEQGLKDMKTAMDGVASAADKLKAVNIQGLSDFGSTTAGVISGARGYDSYYKSFKNQTDTVNKLNTLEKSSVQSFAYTDPATGETVYPTGTPAAIKAYMTALDKQKDQALIDEATKTAKAEIVKIREDNAAERAALSQTTSRSSTSTSTRTTTSKGKTTTSSSTSSSSGTTTTAGRELTPREKLAYDQQIELINNNPMDDVTALKRQLALEDKARAAGFAPGVVPTMDSVKETWSQRGLSANEIEQRANALEALQQLDFSNKEAQFESMRKSAEGYLKTMAEQEPSLMNTKEGQDRFKEAERQMAEGLQNFARSAGLFDSAGFSRSMAEAALSAKLANGEFGQGADAVKKYYDAFGQLQTKIDGLKNVLSGQSNLTVEQANQYGLVDAATAGVSGSTIGDTIKAQAGARLGFLDKVGKKQISAGEVAALVSKTQGIDTTTGIMGIFDQTIGKANDKADAFVKKMQDGVKTVTDIAYELNVTISKDSLAAMAASIAELGVIPAAGATAALGKINAGIGGLGPQKFGTLPEALDYYKQSTLDAQAPGFKPPASFYNYVGPTWNSGDTSGGEPNAAPWGDVGVKIELPPENVAAFEKQAREAIMKTQTDTVDPNPLQHQSVMEQVKSAKVLPLQLQAMHDILQKQADNHPIYFKAIIAGAPDGSGSGSGGEGVNPPPPPAPTRDIGGPVRKGSPYWIGLNGMPELFFPNSDGFVMNGYDSKRFANYSRPVNPHQPIIVNTNSPQNSISIDARGASSPLATQRAVREAVEFISDDPDLVARWADRRKGRWS